MSDKELLEKAARAVGNNAEWDDDLQAMHWPGLQSMGLWNPLEDDGDAFRLAVELGIKNYCDGFCGLAKKVLSQHEWVFEPISANNGDQRAATRRAIVRAAAAIGDQL